MAKEITLPLAIQDSLNDKEAEAPAAFAPVTNRERIVSIDTLRGVALYVAFSVWLFLLIASPIWLRHFRFGPMEWVWRSLTYWRKQPMKITEPARECRPVSYNHR